MKQLNYHRLYVQMGPPEVLAQMHLAEALGVRNLDSRFDFREKIAVGKGEFRQARRHQALLFHAECQVLFMFAY